MENNFSIHKIRKTHSQPDMPAIAIILQVIIILAFTVFGMTLSLKEAKQDEPKVFNSKITNVE